MSDIFILIPSRIGSTRLENKPLQIIEGKSLIQRVFENALSITSNVYVATDSNKIKDNLSNVTNNIIMTSSEHISGTDRVYEASTKLNLRDSDLIINLQGYGKSTYQNNQVMYTKGFRNRQEQQAGVGKVEVVNASNFLKPLIGMSCTYAVNFYIDNAYFIQKCKITDEQKKLLPREFSLDSIDRQESGGYYDFLKQFLDKK